MNLLSHLATVLLAASYLILGALSTEIARDWWLPYAALTLFFSLINIAMERRHARSPR